MSIGPSRASMKHFYHSGPELVNLVKWEPCLLGSPVVSFCPFYLGVSLLKPNSRKKGTLIIKRLLRNQGGNPVSTLRRRSALPNTTESWEKGLAFFQNNLHYQP